MPARTTAQRPSTPVPQPAAKPWTLHVDGAARGNPGPAAAGIVLLDPARRAVRRIGRTLGSLTNNQAEYQALLLALKEAAAYAPTGLQVCMDSELVVMQVTGRYRVKDPTLQRLHASVQAAIAHQAVTFRHVPRRQNAEADRLANMALDGEPVDIADQP